MDDCDVSSMKVSPFAKFEVREGRVSSKVPGACSFLLDLSSFVSSHQLVTSYPGCVLLLHNAEYTRLDQRHQSLAPACLD
ncbi:hypothetical protein BHE90_013706 [Fusarium euwallaceae]|uniref:Uncharacterized protein n=1 Tax=Fusarium euwallaceae TaxID=1147111 RepID=A0A430L854_9HYPO|nr:hypothetical protein BHE90_013706 [Fusarium euwallaceae]